jgi:hypothetical protein
MIRPLRHLFKPVSESDLLAVSANRIILYGGMNAGGARNAPPLFLSELHALNQNGEPGGSPFCYFFLAAAAPFWAPPAERTACAV